tara:strand:- start:334 stop:1203 length:870 start_codon:yes stop_codon:yes gene_type:complete
MPIPVICVGNITAGGNGKTPTALKIQKLLQTAGYRTHILSGGYKSQLKGPLLVNPHIHSFKDVGDEPLMMSSYAPTWIAKNRRCGVKSAHAAGADVVILDDGFQDTSIKKDLSIVVVDSSTAFGNEYLIPAGPLREPIVSGLKRADLLITIGSESQQKRFYLNYENLDMPHSIKAFIAPQTENFSVLRKKVIALAGIGHPRKFFRFLETLGAKIVYSKPFPNHKAFNIKTLENLVALSHKKQAQLVTTEKDFVRLPQNLRQFFKILKIDVVFENEELLLKKMKSVLQVF